MAGRDNRTGEPSGADDPSGHPGEPSGADEDVLNIGDLLSAGVDGLASVTGLQLVGLLAALALASTVAWQSLLASYIELAREEGLDPQVIETLEQLGPLPLALDIPVAVALVGFLLLPLVGEAIRIVGVRAFADGALGGLSNARVWPNLTKATVLGFVGGVVLLVATSLGLTLLIAPGIFVAVTMVFFRQEIAVADKGIVASIRGSWSLTGGHRWDLLGLLAVLVVIGIGLSLVTFLLPATSVLAPVISGVLGPAGTVFSAAVVTEAYVTLRDSRTEQDVPMGPDEIDRTSWDDTTQW